MKELIDKVKEFHKAFKIEESQNYNISGRKASRMRFKLLDEELNEYLVATEKKDNIEIADAIGDQLYILIGTIISHGLEDKIEDIFNEIHRSNMSKLDSNGVPIYREDGKVMKGENYFKPNLKKILLEY